MENIAATLEGNLRHGKGIYGQLVPIIYHMIPLNFPIGCNRLTDTTLKPH